VVLEFTVKFPFLPSLSNPQRLKKNFWLLTYIFALVLYCLWFGFSIKLWKSGQNS